MWKIIVVYERNSINVISDPLLLKNDLHLRYYKINFNTFQIIIRSDILHCIKSIIKDIKYILFLL